MVVVVAATACSADPGLDIASQDLQAAVSTAAPTVAVATPTLIAEPTAAPPAATPTPDAPALVETPTPAPTPAPAPTPQPDGPCGVGPLALPAADRPVYTAELTIDPVEGTVTGLLEVVFTPDREITEVYFRLWPNGPRAAVGGVEMTLGDVGVGIPAYSSANQSFGPAEMVTPTTARVALAEPVPAGQAISVSTTFELFVPVEINARVSGRGDYMRLGTIMPILPWEPGRGWALEAATPLFAESVSSPVADYAVTITTPDDYDVLASGVVDDRDTWRVEAARDFSISVGRFRLVTGIAMAPEPVQVIVGVHETIDDDPDVYLAKIIDSLEQFSSRWGQYPWPSLTFAVTPNLSGGIEFPTHIMQGQNTTGRVTSHEVGHMFFYSLVGNNQATAPWLDEGLTSYAEFTYEGTLANSFEIPLAAMGNATQPMDYWESRSQLYYRAVYAQTGFALQRLGAQADVDCALARYVAANAHRIATAEDFVAAFEPTFPDIVAQLAALGVDLEP